jgi:hypothetical protein
MLTPDDDRKFYEMQPDEIRPLDPNSPNYNRFVTTCKALIDAKLPQEWGFEIEFNPDYTKMKKLC